MKPYRKLTATELEIFEKSSNGCGVWGLVTPKKWSHYESCVKHDYYYVRGGSSRKRFLVDLVFLQDMVTHIERNERNYFKMEIAVWLAISYFVLVRLFGWYFWNKT